MARFLFLKVRLGGMLQVVIITVGARSQETLEEADSPGHCDQRKGGGGDDTQAHRGGGGGRSQGQRLEDLAPDPPVSGA